MTTPHSQEMAAWTGRNVYDPSGQKIGKAGQLWADNDSGQPTWMTVHTGLFGTNESFVPVPGLRPSGDDLQTPYPKEQVKDAPNYDPGSGHIDDDQQTLLYRHYGLAEPGVRTGGQGADTGHDTSGPTTDEAMTVSEERLRAGTQRREAGRARLRKYVVTETETVDVPVSREEVRVEREPITDANRAAAMDGPAISEEEHEMTLHEERPVVETEVVPKERVRLAKEQVTGTERVSGEVRKERVDADDTTYRRQR